jgi:hypothetical protein
VKIAVCLLGVTLLTSGCVSYPTTGKHVPIEGAGSSESKFALAEKVLDALPADKVNKLIRDRYPQLSDKQLKRIHLSYTKMTFIEKDGAREEVHLVVRIHEDNILHPIAPEIEEFIRSLLREELELQGH